MTEISDVVALVTGAAQGIGMAVAKRLAREGGTVILGDINVALARSVAQSLTDEGYNAEAIQLDVADRDEVSSVIAEISRRIGPLTTLVNNAGIAVFEDPLILTKEDWDRCMSVDLEGVWNCTQAALKVMVPRKRGSIVNIASVHATQIIPGCFPYPVAKHAVIGLTRALAVEYGAHKIRINAVSPTYVNTPLIVDYYNGFPDADAEAKRVADLHPLKRIAEPEEIASAVAFLAGGESTFITGVNLPVDGGRSIVFHD